MEYSMLNEKAWSAPDGEAAKMRDVRWQTFAAGYLEAKADMMAVPGSGAFTRWLDKWDAKTAMLDALSEAAAAVTVVG